VNIRGKCNGKCPLLVGVDDLEEGAELVGVGGFFSSLDPELKFFSDLDSALLLA